MHGQFLPLADGGRHCQSFLGRSDCGIFRRTQASFVNPTAIEVMKEIGIDISTHRSKNLSEFDGQNFDYVITLCGSANETCPLYIGGTKKTHIGFDDPAKVQGTKEEILTGIPACAR